MNNREAGRYDNDINKHPPACTCKACVEARLQQHTMHKDQQFKPSIVYQTPAPTRTNKVRIRIPRLRHITYRILIIIAIVFALLSCVSLVAWLLPNAFLSMTDWLINVTHNKDLILNAYRIKATPIPYTVGFAIGALFMRWLAGKFY